MVTAKITCTGKNELTGMSSSGRQTFVTFGPDYADGRNQDWAAATPHLELRMTLNDQAAELFEPGRRYTLQFVKADDAED